MRTHLLATLLIAGGSAIFIVGAFLPVSRIYVTPTAPERLAIMEGRPAMWLSHVGLMGGGALVAAGGATLLAPALGAVAAPAALPALVGGGAMVVGTLFWARHLQLRIRNPAGFAERTNPMWHFALYTALMQVGLLALALAFLRAGYPAWIPLVLALGTGLTLLMFAVFRDVPPFIHYVWLLTVGVGLLLAARNAALTERSVGEGEAAARVEVAGVAGGVATEVEG